MIDIGVIEKCQQRMFTEGRDAGSMERMCREDVPALIAEIRYMRKERIAIIKYLRSMHLDNAVNAIESFINQ